MKAKSTPEISSRSRRSLAIFSDRANSGQSFSERQLYVSALDRLCGEIALVEGISEEQAVKELEGLLKNGTLKRSA